MNDNKNIISISLSSSPSKVTGIGWPENAGGFPAGTKMYLYDAPTGGKQIAEGKLVDGMWELTAVNDEESNVEYYKGKFFHNHEGTTAMWTRTTRASLEELSDFDEANFSEVNHGDGMPTFMYYDPLGLFK